MYKAEGYCSNGTISTKIEDRESPLSNMGIKIINIEVEKETSDGALKLHYIYDFKAVSVDKPGGTFDINILDSEFSSYTGVVYVYYIKDTAIRG